MSLASGAAITTISGSKISSIAVPFPPLPTQRKIAAILSAYDDLIENNTRRIALLEESMRLLYREWFVRLRFPGHETVMVVDGLPEGWEKKTLTEIAEFRLGKMLDQKKNRGDLMPYLANLNVRWGEFDFSDLREMRFEPREIEQFGLKYGDIVMCEGGEPGRCAIWKDTEFKSLRLLTRDKPDWAELARDCVGFANAQGGGMLVGKPREPLLTKTAPIAGKNCNRTVKKEGLIAVRHCPQVLYDSDKTAQIQTNCQ